MPTTTDTRRRSPRRSGARLAALGATFALLAACVLDLRAEQPLGRPGDGRPICGLGRDFHAGRRAELRRRLDGGVILVRGLPETRDYVEFRQDKVFWYLTGIESPGATLLVDEAGDAILFLPEADGRKERWEGELWDTEDGWVPDLTGIDDVRPSGRLLETLDGLVDEGDLVWTSLHPHVALGGCFDRAMPADRHRALDPLDGRESREQALAHRLAERFDVEVRDLSDALNAMRRVKEPDEIAALRRAAGAGAAAMVEAIRSTRPGIGEWDLDALLGFVQQRAGGDGPAYHAIVGSGPNSTVLHYSASSRRIGLGEMICIDAGPELDHYTTDITRSWPSDGVFPPRMAEIYDAVLAAQAAGIEATRPGVTMRDVDRAATDVLRERGLGDLVRHFTCHYVGLEVHDVGDGNAPLEPGVVLTVEPGAYDEDAGIGVRIEDVVVVTEDGCEILTRGVPVEREAVAALVRERGILDGMDGAP